jgi:hypothetical protein
MFPDRKHSRHDAERCSLALTTNGNHEAVGSAASAKRAMAGPI